MHITVVQQDCLSDKHRIPLWKPHMFVHVYELGSRGAVSLAEPVLMEREGGLQDPVCQQPACERHCLAEVHHWQMSKAPPHPRLPPLYSPFPFLVYLPLLSLSTENTESL